MVDDDREEDQALVMGLFIVLVVVVLVVGGGTSLVRFFVRRRERAKVTPAQGKRTLASLTKAMGGPRLEMRVCSGPRRFNDAWRRATEEERMRAHNGAQLNG